MSKFDYRYEKAKFDRKWAHLEKEYAAAGMSTEDIEAMHQFDWEEFNQQRRWQNHETPLAEILPDELDDEEVPIENLNLGIPFSAEDEYCLERIDDRFSWLHEVSDPELLHYLMNMPEINLIVLTEYLFEGKSQREIAEPLGISQSKVSTRLSRIKKNLKKIFDDRV